MTFICQLKLEFSVAESLRQSGIKAYKKYIDAEIKKESSAEKHLDAAILNFEQAYKVGLKLDGIHLAVQI